jgi:putative Holliday junction resolvase
MGRIIAVDMGEKRVGVAISDPSGIIAQPLLTIERHDNAALMLELKKVVEQYGVERIIVGIPYALNGSETKKSIEITAFTRQLQAALHVPIVMEDERLTTRMAENSLHMMGKKVGKSRNKIDQIAAAHILQHYLKRTEG